MYVCTYVCMYVCCTLYRRNIENQGLHTYFNKKIPFRSVGIVAYSTLTIIGEPARHYQGCTNSSWCSIWGMEVRVS